MRNIILAAWLTIGLLPGLATAAEKAQVLAPQNTQELLTLCAVEMDNPEYEKMVHYCIAFLDGVVDYHDAMAEHKDMKRVLCYPRKATLANGAIAFIEWARSKQGDMKLMNEAAVLGAVRGMEEKWPCN